MKNIFLSIFLISFAFTSAQTHRFLYEMSYKSDSLSEKVNKSNMVLDITGNDVQYYDFNAIKTDSINRIQNGYSTYTSSFARLKRSISSEKNENYFLIGDDYFYFKSTDKISWKISPEMKEKNQMKLQKATAKFGGRNWEAWFNKDIPFSEGPFKFNGLPGLIVEVEDTRGNFKFELIKIEKPKNNNPKIIEELFKKTPLKIEFKKYNELLVGNYNDPYSRFRNMKPGSWAIGREDDTFVDSIEGLNKITREEQESIRNNYNPIELDKAVLYEK